MNRLFRFGRFRLFLYADRMNEVRVAFALGSHGLELDFCLIFGVGLSFYRVLRDS